MTPGADVKRQSVRYPNFDIVRLFLAGQVVVAHAWYTVNPNFGWDGFVMAVPCFLAVSGFLVLKSYEETGAWGAFMRKRVLRILPALVASFALCYVLLDGLTAWNSFLNWATGGLYTLPYRANGPLWSLAWEEVAYLLLAVLWVLGAYKRQAIIWVLLAASMGLCWLFRDATPHTKIITFLAPAFFTGNLMYLHRQALLAVHPAIPWGVLFFGVQANYVPQMQWFGGSMLAITEAFAVVWVGMAGFRLQPKTVPDLSYGLYIYHMPFIMLIAEKARNLTSPMMIGATLALTIPFCLASWYLLEKPMLKLKSSRRSARICEPVLPL